MSIELILIIVLLIGFFLLGGATYLENIKLYKELAHQRQIYQLLLTRVECIEKEERLTRALTVSEKRRLMNLAYEYAELESLRFHGLGSNEEMEFSPLSGIYFSKTKIHISDIESKLEQSKAKYKAACEKLCPPKGKKREKV